MHTQNWKARRERAEGLLRISHVLHSDHGLWNGDSSSVYCHVVWSDYRRSFGSDVGFIDHFNTQLIITLN
jgi:hypothetical protein